MKKKYITFTPEMIAENNKLRTLYPDTPPVLGDEYITFTPEMIAENNKLRTITQEMIDENRRMRTLYPGRKQERATATQIVDRGAKEIGNKAFPYEPSSYSQNAILNYFGSQNSKVFPDIQYMIDPPILIRRHGIHQVNFGYTIVRYYVPEGVNEDTEFLFAIHGNGGDLHHRLHYLDDFLNAEKPPGDLFLHLANAKNLIVIAPLFDQKYLPPRWSPQEIIDFYGIEDTGWKNLIKDRSLEGRIRFHEYITKDNPPNLSPFRFFDPKHDFPWKAGKHPKWYRWPEPYLENLQHLYTSGSGMRADIMLLYIFHWFKKRFNNISNNTFNLFGFSAGAQFANRFMMFHPHVLNRIYIDAAGSYAFPSFSEDCYYENFNYENSSLMGQTPPPPVPIPRPPFIPPTPFYFNFGFSLVFDVDDYQRRFPDIDLNRINLLMYLAILFKKHIFLIIGEKDTDLDKQWGRMWQGMNRLEKLHNFRNSMLYASFYLAHHGYTKGRYYWNVSTHIASNIGHDWKYIVDDMRKISHLWPTQKPVGQDMSNLFVTPDFTGPVINSLCAKAAGIKTRPEQIEEIDI